MKKQYNTPKAKYFELESDELMQVLSANPNRKTGPNNIMEADTKERTVSFAEDYETW